MKKTFSIISTTLLIYLVSFSVLSQNKNLNNYSDINRTIDLRINKFNSEKSGSLKSALPLDSVQIEEYAYGKVPYPVGLPDTICAYINKSGINLTKLNVHFVIKNLLDTGYFVKFDSIITITNSNSYDTTICIAAPPYYYPKTDLVIIHAVTGDTSCAVCDYANIDTTNIYKEYCHELTTNTYNHADQCKPVDGGVGFGGTTGNFIAGFSNNSSSVYYINSLAQCFINASGGGNNPYKIVIYGDNGSGSPGPLLYLSPLLSTPPGVDSAFRTTFNIASPVSIPANSRFFVGYRQTSGSNISASFQIEEPIRPRSFYYSLPDTSNTWNDFVIDPNNFRLDIAPIGSTGILNLTAVPEGFYNLTTLNMKDTLRVYLRNSSSPYSIIDSSTGIIDSINFTCSFAIPTAPSGSYYYEVKHRNSIETWSSSPVTYTLGSINYFNFTTSSSMAYGNNIVLKGSKFCLYSGDTDQDGLIDLTDLLNIFNDANGFASGYISTDVNGNSIVDLTDLVICYNNSVNFITKIIP